VGRRVKITTIRETSADDPDDLATSAMRTANETHADCLRIITRTEIWFADEVVGAGRASSAWPQSLAWAQSPR